MSKAIPEPLNKFRWGDTTIFTLTENNKTVIYDLTVPPRQVDGVYTTSTNYTYALTFSFEEEFETREYTGWMRYNWWLALVWIALYVTFIFVGQNYMKDRPRYDLRRFLTIWNIVLAVFSTMGALRTVPEVVHLLKDFGFGFTCCISGKPWGASLHLV